MKCHFSGYETLSLNKQRVTSLQMRSYFSKDEKLSFNNKETHFQYVKCYLSTGGELPQQTRSNLSTTKKIPFERREAHL